MSTINIRSVNHRGIYLSLHPLRPHHNAQEEQVAAETDGPLWHEHIPAEEMRLGTSTKLCESA